MIEFTLDRLELIVYPKFLIFLTYFTEHLVMYIGGKKSKFVEFLALIGNTQQLLLFKIRPLVASQLEISDMSVLIL